MSTTTWIILGVIVVLVLWIIMIYNGLVAMRQKGRQRLYSLNGPRLKTIHDWAKMFERFWTHQLESIKERAERKAREQHPPARGRGARRVVVA